MNIEEKIKKLNDELKQYKSVRQKINELKKEKDTYIIEYMEQIKQPNFLNIQLINYKALHFYFKKNFIELKKTLELKYFYNGIKDNRNKKFIEKFGEEKKIFITIKETNFPHLIGYKQNGNKKDFIKNIYYEISLIEDYRKHKCDLGKIKCISWIWDTLRSPFLIFDKEGLKNTKLEGDLFFIKSMKNNQGDYIYHYVSLKMIDKNKNKYTINSHHKLTEKEFYHKFKKNKKIYEFSWKRR